MHSSIMEKSEFLYFIVRMEKHTHKLMIVL